MRGFFRGYKNILLHGRFPDQLLAWALIIALITIIAATVVQKLTDRTMEIPASQFIVELENNNIANMNICNADGSAEGEFREDINGYTNFVTVIPEKSDVLTQKYLDELNKSRAVDGGEDYVPLEYTFTKQSELSSVIFTLITFIVEFGLIILLFSWLMKRNGGGSMLGLGNMGAAIKAEIPDTTFEDVAGIPEAIEEVSEIVTFLKDPEVYQKVGAKFPKGVLMHGEPGSGKAIPNYANVLTPNGWKRMGNIKSGDTVFTKDGIRTTVTGVFPQKEKKQIWEVTFSDKRVAECCEDHLWPVLTSRGNICGKSTKAMFKQKILTASGHYKYFVPRNKAVAFSKKTLKMHPYIMGALLGDGVKNENGSILISSQDSFIPEKIANYIGEDVIAKRASKNNYNWKFYKGKYIIDKSTKDGRNIQHNTIKVRDFTEEYVKLLTDTYCRDKYIPDEYKFSSIQQREELLAGLLDTDGTAHGGRISFGTVSKKLAYDVANIARSLGIPSTVSVKKREGRTYTYEYNVSIMTKEYRNIVTHPAKVQAIKDYIKDKQLTNPKYKPMPNRSTVAITDIKKTNRYTDMTCISVADSSETYIIDDFVVTHNTLLARALAGEAGVPFIHASGSDFVEMYVGVGAKRVREMFSKAKKMAPSILFIDEIDAVGTNRDRGEFANSEHLQTINALLSEMDGFDNTDAVIVIGATNRLDALDPALIRPGRFDRLVTVDMPAKDGRVEILQHYAQGKAFADEINFDKLAAHTYGFSGAQLEAVMNQAATLAARRAYEDKSEPLITMEDLDEGISRVISGPAMKSKKMNDEEKRETAYHEAGHAVVQYLLPDCDDVQKISIVSRNMPGVGTALGYVQSYSEEDEYVTTAAKCRAEIAALLAGRCSEKMFCEIESAGASNDLERASKLAYHMVDKFAFEYKRGGVVDYNNLRVEVKDDKTSLIKAGPDRLNEIDNVVSSILRDGYITASEILVNNMNKVSEIVDTLMKEETIDADKIKEIMEGNKNEDKNN